MRTVQKLEGGFGLATIVTTIGVILFEQIFLINQTSNPQSDFLTEGVFRIMSLFFIVTLLIVVGTYFHVSRQNKLAFLVVSVSCTFLVIFFGAIVFSGGAFYYYGAGGLLFILPMICAILTIFFAIRQQIVNSRLHMK